MHYSVVNLFPLRKWMMSLKLTRPLTGILPHQLGMKDDSKSCENLFAWVSLDLIQTSDRLGKRCWFIGAPPSHHIVSMSHQPGHQGPGIFP
ncbi:hypothetical protein CEK28_08840 [Xenophilus sp. AP218F]|nr:hypothetical protein CEK28_08840 [Xenophilus sp. AP218F]